MTVIIQKLQQRIFLQYPLELRGDLNGFIKAELVSRETQTLRNPQIKNAFSSNDFINAF